MTTPQHPDTVDVNGRSYAWPTAPTVIVCVDGSEPAYMEQAIADGRMPFLASMRDTSTWLSVHCAMPSYTNPNNMSIVTGRPTEVHGIVGNTYLDPDTGEEVLMNEPRFLRAHTIFERFHEAGARVAIVTAKDKLRRLLAKGLDFSTGRAWCFSSQRADETTTAEHGIDDAASWVGRPVPDTYSAELSEFIFHAGAKLLRECAPDLMYLSTTDFIQHKYAPGSDVANDFYAMLDASFRTLHELGATVVITADHGMKPKHDEDGNPRVVYLQSAMDEKFGADRTRVVLPITDPYPVHHGALGSYATVYVTDKELDPVVVAEHVATLPGIEHVTTQADAVQRYRLPADRTGDLSVVCTESYTVGTTPERHDLSGLTLPLRSHGGLSELDIPMVVTRPLRGELEDRQHHNYDAFHVGLNL